MKGPCSVMEPAPTNPQDWFEWFFSHIYWGTQTGYALLWAKSHIFQGCPFSHNMFLKPKTNVAGTCTHPPVLKLCCRMPIVSFPCHELAKKYQGKKHQGLFVCNEGTRLDIESSTYKKAVFRHAQKLYCWFNKWFHTVCVPQYIPIMSPLYPHIFPRFIPTG